MSGLSPIDRYPALASWIERLANTQMNLSLGEWLVFVSSVERALLSAEAAHPRAGDGEREAVAALETAKSLMMAGGWWTNAAGYQIDAALWIDRAIAALSAPVQQAEGEA